MNIRQAVLEDAPAIQQLLAQLGYAVEQQTQVLSKIQGHSKAGYHLLVGEDGNKVVGFISLHWFDIFHSASPVGRITAMCVDEHNRGQEIGKQLLTAAEIVLHAKGCSTIEVTCNLKRVLTHQFYSKNGYREDSLRFTKTIVKDNH